MTAASTHTITHIFTSLSFIFYSYVNRIEGRLSTMILENFSLYSMLYLKNERLHILLKIKGFFLVFEQWISCNLYDSINLLPILVDRFS